MACTGRHGATMLQLGYLPISDGKWRSNSCDRPCSCKQWHWWRSPVCCQLRWFGSNRQSALKIGVCLRTVEIGDGSASSDGVSVVSDGKWGSNSCNGSAASNDTHDDKLHAVSWQSIDVAVDGEQWHAKTGEMSAPSAALWTCRTNQDSIIIFKGIAI